jgi:hypothetical protein
MSLRVEPFYSFFYIFAWWTYIWVLSCFNRLLGRNSLLLDRTGEFFVLFCFSIVIWLVFEAYNFRLQNWFYLGVPLEVVLRWPGYLLAYGTVLPGLFETENLLRNLGVFSELRGRGIKVDKALRIRLILLGALMLTAPLISPQLFFPSVWVGFVFLLDPILYSRGEGSGSLLRRAEEGKYGRLIRILTAGLICGILWEFWNYWSGSKWIYSIPYFNYLQIFEMPLLGYLGFPFFAVECYLLYQSFLVSREKFLQPRGILLAIVFLAVCFSAAVLYGIDQRTVVTFKMIWSS